MIDMAVVLGSACCVLIGAALGWWLRSMESK